MRLDVLTASGALPLAHVRVRGVGRGREVLLDRAGGDPADQVPEAAGLVVGAGGAGAAEGLLADDGAGGLVVDVEVAGGVAEAGLGGVDGGAVAREHSAGQGVGRR